MVKMIHPDDRAAHGQMYETIRAGYSIEREFRIIRPDGTMRWLQNKAEVIVDAKGAPARAVGVMIDVTDQHASRQSVEDGWHRYKTLVASMAVIEYAISAGGDFSCVGGWYELTGQTENETAEFGCLNAIHPDDRELTKSAWLSAFESGGSYAVDPRIRCKDGQYRRFLSRAAPVFNPDGTIREWIGALLEMSGEKAEKDHSENSMPRLRARHVRAARALLDWTIDELALKAGVSVSSVRRLEADAGQPVGSQVCHSVRKTLEANGIFITSGPKADDVSIHFKHG
ncbi:PAS domain-containing protein [Rhizobium sp. AN6A]|uniref:PAS domain-containing protein n=1 Tax=Rhizobium sp. AN6A TaxID=1841611 RepID=UPI0015CE7BFD|nr:PAS domain-containing protein [Rhizobium sp. AN6A]